MRAMYYHRSLKEELNRVTMKGYGYVVYGETKQGFELKKPRYALSTDTSTRRLRKTEQVAL